jgi:hypothetical protein
MSQITQQRFQLWGWILFIASAIFFMASSIRAGDPLSLIGGAFFLLACFVFLAPLLTQLAASHSQTVDQAGGQDGASSLSPPRRYFRYLPDWLRAVNSLLRAPDAPTMPPVPAHLLRQNQHHSIRSELRFFASTR